MDHRPGAVPAAGPRTGWRVAALALATALAAVGCTARDGRTRSPATTGRPGELPAAAPGGAPAPPPARDPRGLIAYGTQDADIWVMHADGSARRQVTRTRDSHFDFDPSLSPDGTHLHDTGVVGGECAEWSTDGR